MPINYQCPKCGTEGVAEDQYAGQTGPCASCGTQITMPAASSAEIGTAVTAAGAGPPAAKGSSAPIWIAVVAGVLLCSVCVVGLLVAMLLPAVQSARSAARRMECSNNLKQIGLALHGYQSAYGSFPPAYTVDGDGNRLHSWRTLILPFLEQSYLAEQINMEEPWNSPENLRFHDSIVSIYNCPSSDGPSYETNYMVVVGNETAFPPDGNSVGVAQVADGLSNTTLVVEVGSNGTHWMDPTDLEFDDMRLVLNSGPTDPASNHAGVVMVALGDGSVRSLPDDIDSKTLRALLTRAGREVIPIDVWER